MSKRTQEGREADANGPFERLHEWIREHPDSDLRVERLEEFCHMSPRSFIRRYRAATGETPARAVETIRVETARTLLEEGRLPLARIARRSGFGDGERMRRSFLRLLGVPPGQYRGHFSN